MDPLLLKSINNFTSEIENLNVIHEKPSLSKSESDALQQLSKNRNIVIKKSDKGSAIVIMDRHHYLAEGYRQQNNPQHYKRITQPVHTTIKPRLIEILRKMKHEFIITDKELNFLPPPPPPTKPRRTAVLYATKNSHTIGILDHS